MISLHEYSKLRTYKMRLVNYKEQVGKHMIVPDELKNNIKDCEKQIKELMVKFDNTFN